MVRLILKCWGVDMIRTKRITPAEAALRAKAWRDNYRHPGMEIKTTRG